MLRFAIEATCLADARPTGIGRYAQGLVGGLAQLESAGRDYDVTVLYRTSRRRRRHQIETVPGIVRRQSWRGRLWPLSKPYALIHAAFDRMPDWPGFPRVSTIFDVYAAVGINAEDEAVRAGMMAYYRRVAEQSDFIVFISEHSRQDYLRLIGFDEARTAVTPLGVDARFQPQPTAAVGAIKGRYGLDEPYLLFVGLTNPNKNLPRLLQAYAASPARHGHLLAVVGQVPEEQRAGFDATIRSLGLEGRVKLTGYVADADIPVLYAGAAAFLFPSLYEGFGLPILEAMASGVPVLTSTTSACPATAGGHAVLIDPESVEAIATGIGRVLETSPAQRQAAQVYAHSCSWQRTAEHTLAAYHTTLELGRR
jgi:glycosyltransferase involved in cell wall biosynthesis